MRLLPAGVVPFPAVAMFAVLLAACSQEAPPAPAARPVLVVHPGGAAAVQAGYAGDVRARVESPLAFRVGGKLVERRVDVGEHVRAGQVLPVLDAGDLDAQASAARAQAAAAEAQLARARADQARYARLGREQLVSRSTVDAQNAAVAAAQGQADAARASLAVARNQAGYTRLVAPRDGVIAARNAEAGQVVGAGQPVYVLATDGTREVAFPVPEGAVAAITPGLPVEIELWSQPGRRWPGRVREVSPAADPASRTYAARVSVDAPAGALALGQSARVFVAQGPAAALSVPLSALQRREGGAAVFVVDPATSTLRLQPVQVGAFGEDAVPVLRGLAPGDWVVAAGGHLLHAGQAVAPVDRDNRPVPVAPRPAAR